jgi:hypothetical protein
MGTVIALLTFLVTFTLFESVTMVGINCKLEWLAAGASDNSRKQSWLQAIGSGCGKQL